MRVMLGVACPSTELLAALVPLPFKEVEAFTSSVELLAALVPILSQEKAKRYKAFGVI